MTPLIVRYTLYYTRLDALRAQRVPFLASNNSPKGCIISVRVQPRASRNRVLGYRDGWLRVSVTAPPHDGKANAALLELLAGTLGVTKARLRIVRGHASRDKAVAVDDLTPGEAKERLGPLLHQG